MKKRYADPHAVIYYGREEAIRRCQEGVDKWFYEVEEDPEPCCMNCEHQGMQYCPFNKGYTGWDDVHCNKWEPHSSRGKAK